MRFSALILVVFVGPACKLYQQDRNKEVRLDLRESYTGFDLNGMAKVCYKRKTDEPCKKSEGPQDDYAKACAAQGFTVYQCDCHDYLCSSNPNAAAGNTKTSGDKLPTFTGYDLNGVKKTCKAKAPDLMCTDSFGPEDQFALDCQRKGLTYFQCGCHDYICSGNLHP